MGADGSIAGVANWYSIDTTALLGLETGWMMGSTWRRHNIINEK